MLFLLALVAIQLLVIYFIYLFLAASRVPFHPAFSSNVFVFPSFEPPRVPFNTSRCRCSPICFTHYFIPILYLFWSFTNVALFIKYTNTSCSSSFDHSHCNFFWLMSWSLCPVLVWSPVRLPCLFGLSSSAAALVASSVILVSDFLSPLVLLLFVVQSFADVLELDSATSSMDFIAFDIQPLPSFPVLSSFVIVVDSLSSFFDLHNWNQSSD